MLTDWEKNTRLEAEKGSPGIMSLGSGESSWGLCQYKQAIRKISAPKGFRFIDNTGTLCIRKRHRERSEGRWHGSDRARHKKMVTLEPSRRLWWPGPGSRQAARVGSQSLCFSHLKSFCCGKWAAWTPRTGAVTLWIHPLHPPEHGGRVANCVVLLSDKCDHIFGSPACLPWCRSPPDPAQRLEFTSFAHSPSGAPLHGAFH